MIPLTSIGVKVSYAFESVAGTRPTTGYKLIPGVRELEGVDATPDAIETTSLENLEFKTYVPGLKDLGGTRTFTANFTQELQTLWGEVMTEWETAKASGKAMYICIDIPETTNSCYMSVIPSPLGLPDITTNSLLDARLYLTPVGEPIWASQPTYEGTTTYNVTITGYVATGVDIDVFRNDIIVASILTEDTSYVIKLPNGTYMAVARKSGKTTQVEDFVVNNATETVTFDSFA